MVDGMTNDTVLAERIGRVGLITINRPEKRNALNAEVRAGVSEAVDRFGADDEVRVLVITGAGEKAFVAGADIGEFASRTPLEQREAMSGRRMFDAVSDCPKPTIAMINGYALGGGCELALACDIRIAAEHARLGQPEVNLGIIPGGGGTQRLPRVVGTGQALRLILSGDLITAEEALRIGLVDLVFATNELREQTIALAERIATKSPVALRMAKAAIHAAAETPLSAGLNYERELFITCFASEDKSEGISAFLEKRPPEFPGR